jgi:thioredoxin reductase (NADPH)
MAEKVIIIGSGPAGHTAAIYAGRANLEPLMFEGFMAAGVAAGGQLTTTTEVENFPGFPTGIDGTELMLKMREQSVNSGVRIETKTVDRVDLSQRPYKVHVGSEVHEAHTLIISTGATAKRMGVPNEERLWNNGVSACAVCDGGLPLYRGKKLVVVGGGDSAVEEAGYLTKFASKVYMLVRREELRASKVMAQRAIDNPNIEILWNTELVDVEGGDVMESARVKNNKTGEEYSLEAGGLFYAIGHIPNTSFLEGQLEADDQGYLTTQPGKAATEVEGVYAAGDVQDKIYRQAITSAGSGCMAALEAEHYLTAKGLS